MKKKNPSGLNGGNIRRVALMAVLFALTVALTFLEYLLPIPAPVPGIRLGLSNIVVMYSLFFLRKRDALTLAVLKALFVFLTRGAMAGVLSASGGLLSVCAMSVLLLVFSDKISYLMVSVAGAIFHNLGQMCVASLILGSALWYYMPVLLLAGIIAGIATSLLLKATLPVFKRLNLK